MSKRSRSRTPENFQESDHSGRDFSSEELVDLVIKFDEPASVDSS